MRKNWERSPQPSPLIKKFLEREDNISMIIVVVARVIHHKSQNEKKGL